MTFINLLILALIQGITEFLPISSSAHLVLLHEVGGPTGDDIALDVAVHLGSIVAVVLYFRDDVRKAFSGLGRVLRGQTNGPESRLVIGLAIATVPAVIVGAILAITDWIDLLRDMRVIGITMIVFGVLLWWVHRVAPETGKAEDWTLKHALIMGLWQALSLVPGVSRSGITMTAARWLGYQRHSAAKIALLMSIPITLATGALLATKLGDTATGATLWRDAGIAAIFAFGAAYAALALMMRFLDRVSFTPYVIYRVILGAALLVLAYS